MRHFVVIVAVIFAVIGEGWAQNRGSARYIPPEDFDGDITRAPRPSPTRGAGVRRQRPTKAPELPTLEDELKPYQPPESPPRTTARRVPQRDSHRQVAPPPPPPPSVPVQEPSPLHPVAGSEIPRSPSSETEGRPQGTRRRRPKKRRKPQAAVPKADDEQEKQITPVPETDKAVLSELLNEDRKRNEEFQSNPQLRNAPPNFDSNQNFHPEKAPWDSNTPVEQPQRNTAGPQYFRPQPATNRLPIDDSEQVGNSRYLDSSPVVPNVDSPNEYLHRELPSGIQNEASYVPVLNPIRHSNAASRLPPEDYPITRNQESARPLSSHTNIPLRTHGSRSPGSDSNQVIRNAGTRPIHNIIPQSNEPAIPLRSHSEVRLPENEQPLLSSEYGVSNFNQDEGLGTPVESNAKISEDNEEQSSPSNRLPNPSEVHYESVYPEFSDNSQRTAGRRQEPNEADVRRIPPSYTPARHESGTKPQEFDNDAEVDRRQASQYRPPLQRAGSRYRPDDLGELTRTRAQPSPSTAPPRARGSSRYHPSTDNTATADRTRSLPRNPVESNDPPNRTRSVSHSHSVSGNRGAQRHALEESASPSSSRRQPANLDTPPRAAQYTPPDPAYVPISERTRNEQRSPSRPSRTHNPPPPPPPPPSNYGTEEEPEDYAPIRNTLRSRPQYEIRDSEPNNGYEESEEDPNAYNNYEQPRQPPPRGRPNQRTPSTRQETPQPGYQLPPNRQQNRPEPQYEPPQNPRSRQQYQAPQNSRTEYRQASPRENVPSSRQQTRPRNQHPEAPAARGKSGGSNFKCPDAFGFFADSVQCDKYYECRNGTAEMSMCHDGLAFNEASAPNFLRCDSLRDVDCKSRPELQEPQPTKNCPRRYGLFPHETDCTKFWNCVDGTATEVQCPPGLTYNDGLGTCDWADLVESSCKSEDLLGFSCPEPTAFDLQDGVYTRYPHPDNCQLHYTCIKGADGLRRPRMLSCSDGLVFDAASSSCKRPDDVPGCEEFYGPRPPPKRKPAARQPAPREPEPEEELIEEPTPRPRRRGSNRRSRN